jgi:hypothetical protein
MSAKLVQVIQKKNTPVRGQQLKYLCGGLKAGLGFTAGKLLQVGRIVVTA